MGFLQWILEANKKFVILGNMNAINDKEVFPHLERNEIWLGYKSLSQDMYFHVTDDYKQWLIENKKEGSAYKIIDGVVMVVWHQRVGLPISIMVSATNHSFLIPWHII